MLDVDSCDTNIIALMHTRGMGMFGIWRASDSVNYGVSDCHSSHVNKQIAV